MQCLQCRAENREGSRFCAECGAPLAAPCPDCGFTNYSNAKFCGGCGKTLSTPSATETAQKRETAEPERRQLTVMFCDLVGSTALAERLDPEELHELLAQYQDACADVIHRHEGHIARYVGDGLLVNFGYPQAHEDDPQRAVRTGLGIIEAIKDLNPKFTNPGVDLAVRIGIATGLVVAGDIGSGQRREENAIVGETPNLAARLQAIAEPNTVVIGASTQHLVEGLFDCDELGAQNLKGISQATTAYRVSTESGVPSRFEAKATRGLTPLVGREEEIGLLSKRWEQAKDGEGQVVLLSGEAGIGKSRIVRGVRERLEDEPYDRVLYYGSPYHQNSALYPVIDQLERALRFAKDDTQTQKLDKLEAVLTELGLPAAEYAPVLALLLSIAADDRYPLPELVAEQLKKKTLEAIVIIIQAMSSQHPVLMVVEDVHWIDPSTQELISLLIEQLHSYRLFLLITCRPEFESPWGAYAHITSLTLNRLSRKDSTAMIASVTKGKALPDEVLEQIIAKTDGVPLFVEELTKNVLESGLLEDMEDHYELSGPLAPLAIPMSLQDSLMARLDRLGSVKEVAQLAATLGRTFSHELVAAISPLKEKELEDALTQLVYAELIYRRGLPPDVTYEFKHALIQDVAYQSLLKSTRQHYHQQIAHVLQEQFPEIAEIQPELLAHHYTEAGVAEQAINYWQRAGQRASERSANAEAVAHLNKGQRLIANLSESPELAQKELALHITLGPALMVVKGWAATEVEKVYGRARELCRQVGKPTQLFAVLWGLWLSKLDTGRFEAAQDLADEMLTLAERQSDPALLLQAHHAAWTTQYFQGELRLCRHHAEQGIALYNRDEHRSHAVLYGGHDPGVCCRDFLALTLWFLGYPEQGLEKAHDAVSLGQELSHPFSLALALNSLAEVYQCHQKVHLVRERAEALIALCTEQSIVQYLPAGIILRGWALATGGQAKAGIAEILRGLADYRATGAEQNRSQYLVLLADACRPAQQAGEGLSALDEAMDLVQKTVERRWGAEVYRLKGELLLMRSAKNQAEAEACFNQAIQIARKQSAKSLELRAATSLSCLWHDQGKRKEARDLLAPIYDWFTEGFDTADLKNAKAVLESMG